MVALGDLKCWRLQADGSVIGMGAKAGWYRIISS